MSHLYGRISKKYYCEDFVRVYPNGIQINRLGWHKTAPPTNYLNHEKFYAFAAQFARGATLVDIGCGSGYGCALLKKAGAASVCGTDASAHAIGFARKKYGDHAEFSRQGVTNMALYCDDRFDVTLCSEVLEHIKEYGKEDQAVQEIKRITRPEGIVIIGTPNTELIEDHGFSFEEIETIIKRYFPRYCIFENALVPFGPSKELWEVRRSKGRTGVVVTQAINYDDTVFPDGTVPQSKSGPPAGKHRVGSVEIDTSLLHNTHSWTVVAIKDPE